MAGNYGPREIAQEANTHATLQTTICPGNRAVHAGYRAGREQRGLLGKQRFRMPIQDATKATQVDSNYYKGYYRRGLANFAIRRFQEAMDHFKQVMKFCPRNCEVAMKLRDYERETIRHKLDGAVILPNLTRDATKKLTKLRLQGAVSMLESRKA